MSRPTLRPWSRLLGLVLVTLLPATAPLTHAAITGAPSFQVVDGGWGGGKPAEISKVIAAVAEEFPLPDRALPPVRIRHRFGGPMISYDRDRDGWIVMHLSARDDRWYQYVYQFAHEYCHLLSHFDRKQSRDGILSEHQWFEESLCETASLYALRRLAAKWCNAAFDPQLREAAPQLEQYLRQLLAESHRRLDAGTDFATWYSRNRETLRGKPYLRELNELAATQFLPLFERNPNRWAALAYVNPTQPSPEQSFSNFLAAWGAASPPDLKPLVAEMQTLFGMSPTSAPSNAIDHPTAQAPGQPRKGTECGS